MYINYYFKLKFFNSVHIYAHTHTHTHTHTHAQKHKHRQINAHKQTYIDAC